MVAVAVGDCLDWDIANRANMACALGGETRSAGADALTLPNVERHVGCIAPDAGLARGVGARENI